MKNILWKSLAHEIKSSNLNNFEKYLSKNYQTSFKNNYEKIWKWSIENSAEFWKSIWKFSNVKGKLGKKLLIKSKIFYKNNPETIWYAGGKVNLKLGWISHKGIRKIDSED